MNKEQKWNKSYGWRSKALIWADEGDGNDWVGCDCCWLWCISIVCCIFKGNKLDGNELDEFEFDDTRPFMFGFDDVFADVNSNVVTGRATWISFGFICWVDGTVWKLCVDPVVPFVVIIVFVPNDEGITKWWLLPALFCLINGFGSFYLKRKIDNIIYFL